MPYCAKPDLTNSTFSGKKKRIIKQGRVKTLLAVRGDKYKACHLCHGLGGNRNCPKCAGIGTVPINRNGKNAKGAGTSKSHRSFSIPRSRSWW
jgi:hypothetical protein